MRLSRPPSVPRWRESRVGQWLRRWMGAVPEIGAPLWQTVVQSQPFVAALGDEEQAQLKHLCAHFLARKTFAGAQGLHITDEMALRVATQACLPWLHWGQAGLEWYQGFVGIVIHPDEVLAWREVSDEAGVVHRYSEVLAGEAMQGGPVMLAWSHVLGAAEGMAMGHNLVIHEFAHVIDTRYKRHDEPANGCPKLPRGLMGLPPAEAEALWQRHWSEAYAAFVRAVEMADRFGAPAPWLDAYGATHPAEFFAVACEAYTVQRERFAQDFGAVCGLLDAFFKRPAAPPPTFSGATRP
jgi:MtfA peptidase